MRLIIRSLLCVFAITLVIQCERDEPQVIFKDNNFLNALIESGIDTDGDGQISLEEAEVVISLNVSNDSISDMTGIEKFINLDTLYCANNQLTSLTLSNCIDLTYLYCDDNQLTSLDVSDNINLNILSCSYNQLTSLDVSGLPDLNLLCCGGNQLTSLDISNNSCLGEVDL